MSLRAPPGAPEERGAWLRVRSSRACSRCFSASAAIVTFTFSSSLIARDSTCRSVHRAADLTASQPARARCCQQLRSCAVGTRPCCVQSPPRGTSGGTAGRDAAAAARHGNPSRRGRSLRRCGCGSSERSGGSHARSVCTGSEAEPRAAFLDFVTSCIACLRAFLQPASATCRAV